jgi:hypothetical protein
MSRSPLSCVITVPGRKTLSAGLYDPSGVSSTVRPLHDQTRPVREFFRGMSAYGQAVRLHVLGCKHCTPNQVVMEMEREPQAATMRPAKILKSLFRRDPRTDRRRAARMIGKLDGARAFAWMARFGTEQELWECMLGAQEQAVFREEEWGQKAKAPRHRWMSHGRWFKGEYTGAVELHENVPANKPAHAELVRLGAMLHNAGGTLPKDRRALRRMTAALEVHTS